MTCHKRKQGFGGTNEESLACLGKCFRLNPPGIIYSIYLGDITGPVKK